MFWNFYIDYGLYYPIVMLQIMPIQTNTPFVAAENKTENLGQQKKIMKPILNLTAKDLEQENYEIRKKAWTEEEDGKLKRLREEQKLVWSEISTQIPNRNSKMCYNRFRRLENTTKNSWKNEEDERNRELVAEYGTNWKQISKKFKGRTSKQIKEHYLNFLSPDNHSRRRFLITFTANHDASLNLLFQSLPFQASSSKFFQTHLHIIFEPFSYIPSKVHLIFLNFSNYSKLNRLRSSILAKEMNYLIFQGILKKSFFFQIQILIWKKQFSQRKVQLSFFFFSINFDVIILRI